MYSLDPLSILSMHHREHRHLVAIKPHARRRSIYRKARRHARLATLRLMRRVVNARAVVTARRVAP